MDDIQIAYHEFNELIQNYRFDLRISCHKKLVKMILDFRQNDFHHIAGLQYVDDIDIPKNGKKLFEEIEAGNISDEYLQKSPSYYYVQDSYANVHDWIYSLRYLKAHLENKNVICEYIKGNNRYSSIKADYVIKSTLKENTAYIFLRKRSREETYCICSFFNPLTEYLGNRAYWLYKARIDIVKRETDVLYQSKSYEE